MLNKLIDFAIYNRLLIILLLLGLAAACYFLLPKLNFDAFPDVTNIQVEVNTEAPGLSADNVEQLISYPIEAAMYALPEVTEVRSISKTGLSVVTIVFKDGVDIYFARQQVFQQLQTAREAIPEGVGVPEIGPNTSGLGQIFQYVLETDDPETYTPMALRSLNDWFVKLQLLPIEGVTEVLSFGGDVLQYQVALDPNRLLAYDLSAEDVVRAIAENNRNAGGWYLDRGHEQLVIRAEGWLPGGIDGLQAIADIALKEDDGTVVRINNVADVNFGSEIRQGAVTMMVRDDNGAPVALGEAVTGIVLKRIGANTKKTIDDIKVRLPAIQAALPEGVTLSPIYDQSNLVSKATSTVVKALLEAFVLIFIVLLIFLVNFRASLLVMVSAPVSIGIALILMSYWGLSANLMSLGGLAIAIGMIVDGSVVMVENIYKYLDRAARDPASIMRGGTALAIQQAAHDIASPVFFAVMIIIIVFAPLFSLQGVEGKLFHPMAQSIVLSMLASLFVALIVVPALATYLFKKGLRHRDSVALKFIQKHYKHYLLLAFRQSKYVILAAVTLFIIAISLLRFTGTEFVPELEEGALNIRVTLAPSSSLTTALEVAEVLEAQVMSFPEVTYVSSRIGRPELGGDPEPVSNIEILVGLKPVSEWATATNRQQLQQQMLAKMSTFPGLLFSFSQPIATRVDELLSGVKAQLAIKLFGPDLTLLAAQGKAIEHLVQQVEGTQDVSLEQISGEAQLVVRPDRELLMRYGITVDQVMSLVADLIGGGSAGQIISGNERYDIYVRLAEPYRDSAEAIANLILQSPKGAWVRLGDVASIAIESGPPQIRRDDVQRRVVVQANVAGRDMGSVVAEIQDRITMEIELPDGYAVAYGGQFENQERAQARLMIIVPISLLLIFLLLYFAFSSLSQALLIMVNVPLALIGGIIALFISGQFLSVPGSIGFIALFGIAVLNGVVLVNAINQRAQMSSNVQQAIFYAAVSRLRPVLLTAIIAALGLIPMLLARGVGAEVQRPLATVVVGGLFSSTLLTLIVLPVLYQLFFARKAVKR